MMNATTPHLWEQYDELRNVQTGDLAIVVDASALTVRLKVREVHGPRYEEIEQGDRTWRVHRRGDVVVEPLYELQEAVNRLMEEIGDKEPTTRERARLTELRRRIAGWERELS